MKKLIGYFCFQLNLKKVTHEKQGFTFLKLTFLLPILFILLWVVILLVDGLVRKGSVNLDSLIVLIGIMLVIYSLPYWCVYALIMIKSNAKQNLDSFKKSVAYSAGLGFLAIF